MNIPLDKECFQKIYYRAEDYFGKAMEMVTDKALGENMKTYIAGWTPTRWQPAKPPLLPKPTKNARVRRRRPRTPPRGGVGWRVVALITGGAQLALPPSWTPRLECAGPAAHAHIEHCDIAKLKTHKNVWYLPICFHNSTSPKTPPPTHTTLRGHPTSDSL